MRSIFSQQLRQAVAEREALEQAQRGTLFSEDQQVFAKLASVTGEMNDIHVRFSCEDAIPSAPVEIRYSGHKTGWSSGITHMVYELDPTYAVSITYDMKADAFEYSKLRGQWVDGDCIGKDEQLDEYIYDQVRSTSQFEVESKHQFTNPQDVIAQFKQDVLEALQRQEAATRFKRTVKATLPVAAAFAAGVIFCAAVTGESSSSSPDSNQIQPTYTEIEP